MYIENNSLVAFISRNSKLPQMFVVTDKNKAVCVCSKYSLLPSKKENVQLSVLDDIHLYYKMAKNIYLVNPRRHDIVRTHHFLKNYKFDGNFYLLINI